MFNFLFFLLFNKFKYIFFLKYIYILMSGQQIPQYPLPPTPQYFSEYNPTTTSLLDPVTTEIRIGPRINIPTNDATTMGTKPAATTPIVIPNQSYLMRLNYNDPGLELQHLMYQILGMLTGIDFSLPNPPQHILEFPLIHIEVINLRTQTPSFTFFALRDDTDLYKLIAPQSSVTSKITANHLKHLYDTDRFMHEFINRIVLKSMHEKILFEGFPDNDISLAINLNLYFNRKQGECIFHRDRDPMVKISALSLTFVLPLAINNIPVIIKGTTVIDKALIPIKYQFTLPVQNNSTLMLNDELLMHTTPDDIVNVSNTPQVRGLKIEGVNILDPANRAYIARNIKHVDPIDSQEVIQPFQLASISHPYTPQIVGMLQTIEHSTQNLNNRSFIRTHYVTRLIELNNPVNGTTIPDYDFDTVRDIERFKADSIDVTPPQGIPIDPMFIIGIVNQMRVMTRLPTDSERYPDEPPLSPNDMFEVFSTHSLGGAATTNDMNNMININNNDDINETIKMNKVLTNNNVTTKMNKVLTNNNVTNNNVTNNNVTNLNKVQKDFLSIMSDASINLKNIKMITDPSQEFIVGRYYKKSNLKKGGLKKRKITKRKKTKKNKRK